MNATTDAVLAGLGEVPANRARFYHGASASDAASILVEDILP